MTETATRKEELAQNLDELRERYVVEERELGIKHAHEEAQLLARQSLQVGNLYADGDLGWADAVNLAHRLHGEHEQLGNLISDLDSGESVETEHHWTRINDRNGGPGDE